MRRIQLLLISQLWLLSLTQVRRVLCLGESIYRNLLCVLSSKPSFVQSRQQVLEPNKIV